MAARQAKPKQSRKKSKELEPPKEIVIDFDSNWKFLIIKYFYQFVDFFLPELYADLDTSRPPVFLDNELQTIWRSMKTGLKMTDKLVRVYLKNGEEQLLLVHIEIQARFETLFSKRMFTISYRILDKYDVHPVALAVFVDTPVPSQYNIYEHKLYETETSYKYKAYKVIDQIETELLKRDDNIFSLAVLANLRTIQTKAKEDEKKETALFDRFIFKKHLYNLLNERNFEPEVYFDVLNFINYLMILPEQLEIEYDNFTSSKTIKNEGREMLKMKPAPSTIKLTDALVMSVYGMDIQGVKRQVQSEKRKAKRAEVKANEAEVKANEAEVKLAKGVLALKSDRTVDQIAAILGISVAEVNTIIEGSSVKR
jgi:hypothetical protein